MIRIKPVVLQNELHHFLFAFQKSVLQLSNYCPTKNTALQNISFPFSQKLRNITSSAK
jgi:hypothetical protein